MKRFSLRSLLLATTVACLALGTWTLYVKPYRDQAIALDKVIELGGEFQAQSAQGPGWHQWLVRMTVGDERFVEVTHVDLSGKPVDDDVVRVLGKLVYLRELKLDRAQLTDEGIAALRPLTELEVLSLRYNGLTDASVPLLASFPHLQVLYLTGARTTDAAVADLARLDQLDDLFIRWTGISREGAEELAAALPNCAVHHHALQPVEAN